MHPVLKSMTTEEKKKIFTSVFLLLLNGPFYHKAPQYIHQSAVCLDNCDSFNVVPVKSHAANMVHFQRTVLTFSKDKVMVSCRLTQKTKTLILFCSVILLHLKPTTVLHCLHLYSSTLK